MRELARLLIKAGSAYEVPLEGLKADRRPVLAGGLAAMLAVFNELGVQEMRYCPTALREGVLYDLIGRVSGSDMREITVEQMAARYGIDPAHSHRVADLTVALFDQVALGGDKERVHHQKSMLRWAAILSEIGMSVAHDSFHKHSAYLLMNSDMPGFSQSEQAMMSRIALGQSGGLRKLRDVVRDDDEWLMILCLRIASILHRHRDGEPVPVPSLARKNRTLQLQVAGAWVRHRPLSDATLCSEIEVWNERGIFESVEYKVL